MVEQQQHSVSQTNQDESCVPMAIKISMIPLKLKSTESNHFEMKTFYNAIIKLLLITKGTQGKCSHSEISVASEASCLG